MIVTITERDDDYQVLFQDEDEPDHARQLLLDKSYVRDVAYARRTAVILKIAADVLLRERTPTLENGES